MLAIVAVGRGTILLPMALLLPVPFVASEARRWGRVPFSRPRTTLRLIDDRVSDRKACSRGGTRRVADMENAMLSKDDEVIGEFAMSRDRLRSHPGWHGDELV